MNVFLFVIKEVGLSFSTFMQFFPENEAPIRA